MRRFDMIDIIGSIVIVGIVAFSASWWAYKICDFIINN
jgi:hypothetical protein